VINVKVRFISLIGVGLLLLVIASLPIYGKVSTAENEADNSFSQSSQGQREVVLKELDNFQESLSKEGGFFKQVGDKLKEKEYDHSMLRMFYSKDEIWIKFVLTNREANKQEKIEVKAIFDELVNKNNLDPKIFKVKVSNDDSPDW
jgi:hypothetical protein